MHIPETNLQWAKGQVSLLFFHPKFVHNVLEAWPASNVFPTFFCKHFFRGGGCMYALTHVRAEERGDVKIREEKGVTKETGSGEKRRGRASTRVSSNSRLCRSLQGGLFGEKSGLTRFS